MGPKYRWYYIMPGWVYAMGPTSEMTEQEFLLWVETQSDLSTDPTVLGYWRAQ